jgi:hypothetical protein
VADGLAGCPWRISAKLAIVHIRAESLAASDAAIVICCHGLGGLVAPSSEIMAISALRDLCPPVFLQGALQMAAATAANAWRLGQALAVPVSHLAPLSILKDHADWWDQLPCFN